MPTHACRLRLPLRRARLAQGGRSLIEIMIALVIGFVILGAIMLNTAGTGDSGRKSDAQAQLEEQGRIALNMITTQIRLAGRSPVQVNAAPGETDRNYTGIGIRGCDQGFTDYKFSTAVDINALTCNATSGASPTGASFSVMYEADASPSGAVPPTDCTGSGGSSPKTMPSALDASVSVNVVENRFFIDQPAGTTRHGLYCIGTGGEKKTELVPNIESMMVWYGISQGMVPMPGSATGAQLLSNQVVNYVTQQKLDDYMKSLATSPATPVPLQDEWARVVSVRVCLIVTSDTGMVTAQTSQYLDCNGKLMDSIKDNGDTRMRRAVTATVVRPNRVS